ncbi:MAG: hypothetical protein ACK5LO_04300 [Leucobacter sp.]
MTGTFLLGAFSTTAAVAHNEESPAGTHRPSGQEEAAGTSANELEQFNKELEIAELSDVVLGDMLDTVQEDLVESDWTDYDDVAISSDGQGIVVYGLSEPSDEIWKRTRELTGDTPVDFQRVSFTTEQFFEIAEAVFDQIPADMAADIADLGPYAPDDLVEITLVRGEHAERLEEILREAFAGYDVRLGYTDITADAGRVPLASRIKDPASCSGHTSI